MKELDELRKILDTAFDMWEKYIEEIYQADIDDLVNENSRSWNNTRLKAKELLTRIEGKLND